MNYDGMISRSKVHCEVASGCEVLTAMVHSAYDKLEADMKEYKAKSDVLSILRHEDGSERMMDELHTPGRVRSSGRSKKRLGSIMDKKIASKTKKNKTTQAYSLDTLHVI
ncbi:hypothetical protein PIB30_037686 [Stylosanthes scabra]|uniref:Uncharacterized protein n=1 Tax=Stylosanthes scabra TaxID=79078 RepID=A0ABU6WDX9_9FABA|nr:hypothetical protein [Stylosanthes scabra]